MTDTFTVPTVIMTTITTIITMAMAMSMDLIVTMDIITKSASPSSISPPKLAEMNLALVEAAKSTKSAADRGLLSGSSSVETHKKRDHGVPF